MRTDHCMATRCAAAPWAAKRSGCASRCSSFQRASRAARSWAKLGGTAKSSKSVSLRFMASKSRQPMTRRWRLGSEAGGKSDAEAFAAAAPVALVRIVELEALVESLAHEIQLRAIDVGE